MPRAFHTWNGSFQALVTAIASPRYCMENWKTRVSDVVTFTGFPARMQRAPAVTAACHRVKKVTGL